MKWIVGMDLRGSEPGVMAVVRWLASRASTPTAHEFVGVHVLEGLVASFAGPGRLDELERRAEELASTTITEYGAPVDTVRVVHSRSGEEGLAKSLSLYGADALLIGRRSKVGEDAVVRLGRVARRLIRRLPGPLLVVAPDLMENQLGSGPVLLAADPHDPPESAAVFARDLAARVDRRVLVVGAIQSPLPTDLTYLPSPRYDPELRTRATESLEHWLRRGDPTKFDYELVESPLIGSLLEATQRHRACAVVCGSRLLSSTERVFQSSTGSTLAGMCPVPVAIVPPGVA